MPELVAQLQAVVDQVAGGPESPPSGEPPENVVDRLRQIVEELDQVPGGSAGQKPA